MARRAALSVCCTVAWLTSAPAAAHDDAPRPDHEEHDALEVEVREDPRASEAASRLLVGRRELELRPRRRPADLVEAVPGAFAVQHAGGGKAAQYFLRGFDADHGTDVAFFVDGVPVNLPSHGHGQGYTDLGFLIPELVVNVDAYKGPNWARFGDFATAGAIDFQLAEVVPESYASAQVGQYGVARGLVVASPALADDWRAVVAADASVQEGPFVHSEKLGRSSLFARTSHDLGPRQKLSLTLSSYAARWYGSGQIPARAVCGEGEPGAAPPSAYGEPCLEPFDSVDASEGGSQARHSAALAYALVAHSAELHALSYVTLSRWNLYSNFTFFARDPQNGDGIEQVDDRTTLGGHARVLRHFHHGRTRFAAAFGAELRADSIDNALWGQRQRERLAQRVGANVSETQSALYVEGDLRLAPALRFLSGLRVQRVDVRVEDRLEDLSVLGDRSSGSDGASLLLPKLGVVVTPVSGWDVSAHYGRGFHSNDARGAVRATGTVDLLTPALGYEVGTRVEPWRGVSAYASAFWLDLGSEQVWVGDEGTTEASGATRRLGLELGARAKLGGWLYADADLTLTRAEYRDGPESGSPVPLAPTRTFTAGIGARHELGAYTPFGALRLRALADRAASEDGALVAEGHTLLDASAGLRWKRIEAGVDVQNVTDARWREVSFATESRLSYEPAPVTGVHYTPGWPRTVLGRVTLYMP
ncbi:MAG: TonB-dependent receptor [Polyangiaceae bacterium]|nr:TonB-dependent receptor [Polyangiaceae bacterium]MCE7890635.1 TonB-dependent receptor [Sorangiineae bacterium PRO1]MCL4753967.1 TonB-dependent receptor [Myxococcales bacterium]